MILHDHIQQLLVAATMRLQLVERADVNSRRAAVERIESILNDAIAATRSLTVELSPPVLAQAGLAAALRWLAGRVEDESLFKVHVTADDDAEPTTESVRYLLFECVRELLLNAIKHSGVHEGRVIVSRAEDGSTQIVVEDEGAGFDPMSLSAPRMTGLFSIQERLAYLGGGMKLENVPRKGTRVVLLAPSDAPRKGRSPARHRTRPGLGATRHSP